MKTLPLKTCMLNVVFLIVLTIATQSSASEPVIDETRQFRIEPTDSHTIWTELENLPAGARILLTITSNHSMYKIRAFGPPPDGVPKDGPLYQIAENNGTELDCKTVKAGLHKISFEPIPIADKEWRKTFEGTYRIRVWPPE